MKTYFVFLSLLIGAGVEASADCSNHKSCFAFQEFVQQVAIIGKVDNRFTYDDYKLPQNNMFKTKLTQGQVHSLTGATGAFFCGGMGGGANLVMRNNLLLLNAHAFFKYSDPEENICSRKLTRDELAKCQFRTIDGNGNLGDHPYFIIPDSLRTELRCDNSRSDGHDAAVVELQEVVEGASYYDVLDVRTLGTPDNDYKDLLGTKTITISARNSNFKRDGVLMNVPTICEGFMGHFQSNEDSSGSSAFVQTTGCSTGRGGSGGGVIIPRGTQRPAIVGIVASSNGSNHDYQEYSLSNSSAGPLIEGHLADVLKSCERKCPPLSKSVSN